MDEEGVTMEWEWVTVDDAASAHLVSVDVRAMDRNCLAADDSIILDVGLEK